VDTARPQPRRIGLNASADDQQRLLDLQALDTRIDQIAHRRASLPQLARLAELDRRLSELRDELVVAQTEQTDINRELVKAEGDVELVRQRAARDRGRLDSGQGTHKDLESLQHELGSLAKRQSELEDVELEVMQRLEDATARAERTSAELATTQADHDAAAAERDEAFTELDADSGEAGSARDSLAATLPTDLVALYEKIRANSAGVGAAALHRGRCEGCRLELTPTDLQRIRSAPPDEVLRCEECRRILVRVPESGL
jgi:predicted  nucleic acid-binding Zn-ribbon protein